MKYTNRNNLPASIVRAVTNDPYQPKGSNITATRIIQPPRIRVLEMRNWDLLEKDVSDQIFSLLGTNVHHILQRSKRGHKDIVEKRLFYRDKDITNEWTLSGQFDLLEKEGRLMDFKVTSVYQIINALKEGKADWDNQLNVLDFLCRKNQNKLTMHGKEIKVRSLNILAIARDWSMHKVETSNDYPKDQVMMIPIRRWTPDEQESYIKTRIKFHQDAERSKSLPLCTPTERWARSDKWAVYKDGLAKAKRVLDTKELALQYLKNEGLVEGKGCKIVFRKGEDVRCQHYCSVNGFCDYFMGVKF